MDDEIWQVLPQENNKNTNCVMPKSVLNQVNIHLPLIYKVTNLENNNYAFCVADNFRESDDHVAMISPIVMNYLKISEIASIDLINNSPDLLPHKAKTVIFEPQDPIFYKLKDPQKTLERSLKDSYILGVGYLMPIDLKVKTFTMKVVKIIDEHDKEVNFANINNIDINVDFLPLPEGLKPKTNTVIKKKLPIKKTPPATSTSKPPLYDPQKPWVPFCGWGHRLFNEEYITGIPQT